MVLGLAAGLGGAALGGVLSGFGAAQQGGAMAGAGRQSLRNIANTRGQLNSEQDYTMGGMADLGQQSNRLLGDRVQAFGPGQQAALAAARPEAQATTQRGVDQLSAMIKPRGNYMQQGAGLGTQIAAQRASAARAQPGRALRNLQLSHGMTAPQQQMAQQDYGLGLADLGRQGQELGADSQYRRGGILGANALAAQQAGFDMRDARQAGAGLSALGQFSSSLAPGLTWGINDYQALPPKKLLSKKLPPKKD